MQLKYENGKEWNEIFMQRSVLHSKRSALEWVSFFLIRYICFIFAHSSIKCYFWSAKWFKYGRLNWWEILWTAKCKFRVRPILVAQKLQNWRRTWEQTFSQFSEKMSIFGDKLRHKKTLFTNCNSDNHKFTLCS